MDSLMPAVTLAQQLSSQIKPIALQAAHIGAQVAWYNDKMLMSSCVAFFIMAIVLFLCVSVSDDESIKGAVALSGLVSLGMSIIILICLIGSYPQIKIDYYGLSHPDVWLAYHVMNNAIGN